MRSGCLCLCFLKDSFPPSEELLSWSCVCTQGNWWQGRLLVQAAWKAWPLPKQIYVQGSLFLTWTAPFAQPCLLLRVRITAWITLAPSRKFSSARAGLSSHWSYSMKCALLQVPSCCRRSSWCSAPVRCWGSKAGPRCADLSGQTEEFETLYSVCTKKRFPKETKWFKVSSICPPLKKKYFNID